MAGRKRKKELAVCESVRDGLCCVVPCLQCSFNAVCVAVATALSAVALVVLGLQPAVLLRDDPG